MFKILGYIWKALFIVLYPFLALFSLVFTSLIRLFSAASQRLHTLLEQGPGGSEASPAAPPPFTLALSTAELQFSPLKPIHFGPYLYQLKEAPEGLSQYRGLAFSNWHYRTPGYLMLQHWPHTAEHTLEHYQLLVVNVESGRVERMYTFSDFDWRVEAGEDGLIVSCPSTNEQLGGL